MIGSWRSMLAGGAGMILALAGCAAPSIAQIDARDRQEDYQRSMKEYAAAEQDYLDLLRHLETYPTDTYLLEQLATQRKIVEQARTVMLQSRGEFDDAVRKWDDYVRELRSLPRDSVPVNPRIPTSPGHLVEPIREDRF